MAPNEAVKCENWEKVLKHHEKYAEEFKSELTCKEKFKINDTVLIRKEIKLSKMDNEFEEEGIILRILGEDVYEVKTGKSILVRHGSQLKIF